MVNDLAGLVSLVQIGVLEFHVWGARADRLDRPDLIVFDIDPDPAVPWARVVETAVALRVFLEELDLAAFARTTGGKGAHVVVPLVRRATWDEVRDFSQGTAKHLVRLAPGSVHCGDVEGAAQGEDLHRLGAQHARGDRGRFVLDARAPGCARGAAARLGRARIALLPAARERARGSAADRGCRIRGNTSRRRGARSRGPHSIASQSEPTSASPPGKVAENCAIEPSTGLGGTARPMPDRMAQFVLRRIVCATRCEEVRQGGIS